MIKSAKFPHLTSIIIATNITTIDGTMAFARPIPLEPWKHGSQKFQDMVAEFNPKGMDYFIIKEMAGDPISIQEKMMFEGNRLLSFQTWPPQAKAYSFQLSRSGFYYSGEADEVICFACEGKIRDWQEGDVPMQRHIQQYPSCPFVCGQIAGMNLLPPDFDENHPSIKLLKKTDEVVRRTTETSRMFAARQSASETNMTSSSTPGQVMVRPVRTQNMGVTRSAIAFRDENERRKTFEGFWSDTWPVSPKALAQAGFYYCGPDDMVQCAWCYGKLQGWEQGDNPLREHAKHFASCPKFGDRKVVNASSLVNVHNVQGDSTANDLSEDDLGILTVRPCNPQFAIEAQRLESFKGKWPSNLAQTPDHLSSAGFFYVGYSDNVKCFFCDGGLCNWEADDEPWTEHARWFPDCGFLKQVKGTKFIQKVRDIGVNGGPVSSGDDAVHRTSSRTSAGNSSGSSSSSSSSGASTSRGLSMDQKREVRAAMSSPSVVKALETGVPKEAIEMAIKNRLLAGNGHFRDDEALIAASLAANDQLHSQIPTPMDSKPAEGPSDAKKHKRKNKDSPPPPSEKMEEEVKREEVLSPEVPMNFDSNSNGADAKSLEEENLKLKEQRICKICMDEEVSIVLLPCGHLVSCVKCAPALRNCPICRNGIKGTVRTFMA